MKKNKSHYFIEYQSFANFLEGKKIPISYLFILFLKSCLALIEMLIRYIPGGFGYIIRYQYYKLLLNRMGKNVLIDVGVFLNGTKNISIGDYTWIDTNCRIEAILGKIDIGKRVHIAPNSIIASREPVIIGDYVGIGAGARIYANSERSFGGMRMSGPMIPEKYKSFYSKKIVLEKDSCVGTGAVLLPGANLGEGAVAGANTVVKKSIAAYDIVAGLPPRIIGKREKVKVPEI